MNITLDKESYENKSYCYYLEGYSFSEIGSKFGKSESTVRRWVKIGSLASEKLVLLHEIQLRLKTLATLGELYDLRKV